MANRDQRARIAAETMAIVASGVYRAPSGREVVIGDVIRTAEETSMLITPGDFRSLQRRATEAMALASYSTTFAVSNETTLSAARRLAAKYGSNRTAALNFASAKNPGGGFMGGSQAQEESLARASALYSCLNRNMAYYDANRASPSLLYTDHMIVSPEVPVFRDDADQLLEDPFQVTFITSPAPNAGAIAKTQPDSLDQIEVTFRRRMEHVLSAAIVQGQTALVLGAWGCGVFGNDSEGVAGLFAELLLGTGHYAHAFQHVEFAVLDRRGDTIAPFSKIFG
ncbi:MAG TPA: TIGR02452 family protein [Tepidisphaeraceae bacterium]|jgi:uncharacterized protein (TIGR02452 family)